LGEVRLRCYTSSVNNSSLRQAQDIGQYFKRGTEILYTKTRSNDKRRHPTNEYDARQSVPESFTHSVGKEMAQRQVATVTQQHHDTETSDPQSYDWARSEPTSHDFKHQITNAKSRGEGSGTLPSTPGYVRYAAGGIKRKGS
jgi:hypothetical protein